MRADWWKDHFDLETLSGYGLSAKAGWEAAGAARLAGLKPGMNVLDLCCGAGRHAVLLAEKGFKVTGVDIKADLLAAARKEAAARGVELELLRRDMRRLALRGRFDAVLNFFTSFGYFAREEDDLAALAAARRALKPGGRLVMDLLNQEWLLRHFKPEFVQRERRGPVASVHNRMAFDFIRGRLENQRTFIYRGGRRRRTHLSIRVYAQAEIRRLLKRAGFRIERIHGDLRGRPYGKDTFRMVVTARRI